mgnify:CR=1 FL=1
MGYNAAISGLNLNFNRVHFEWKPTGQGWQLAMDARGTRFVPPVVGVKVALAAREAPIFAYEGSDPTERWTVAEPALREAGSRWLPVRRPTPYVAEVFATLAAAHCLTLPRAEIMAQPPADAVEIVAHEGEELTAVLADMLRFSTNLTAEAVGLTEELDWAVVSAVCEAAGAAGGCPREGSQHCATRCTWRRCRPATRARSRASIRRCALGG